MSKTALRSACSWLENAVKQEDIICLLTKWKKEASGSVLAPVLRSARLNKLPDSKALSLVEGSPLWKAGFHFKTILLN